MMNKHGLNRAIPESVKREVRKRCGFGCVICAEAIYEYDHFDPEYKDAREHTADGIALLCANHHSKKTRGQLTKSDYKESNSKPKALKNRKAITDWGVNYEPQMVIGLKTFSGGTSVLKIDGEVILGFKKPENGSGIPRLCIKYFNDKDQKVFEVNNNEIIIPNDAFDVRAVGSTWTVNSKPYDIGLEISFQPPTRITIRKLKFKYKGWMLNLKGEDLAIECNGEPCVTIKGTAKIVGDCLYDLKSEDNGNIVSKDNQIIFGVAPSPIGSIPNKEKGFTINNPIYLNRRKKEQTPQILKENSELCLVGFLKYEFAEKQCLDGYYTTEVSDKEFIFLANELRKNSMITHYGFNLLSEDFPYKKKLL